MKPYIVLLGKEIPLYGLFFYLGIAAAVGVACFLRKRKSIGAFDLAGSAVYAMVGAVLGAKLLYLAVSLEEILSGDIPLLYLIKSGFVFYGGLLGGIAGLCIYTRQFGLPRADYFSLYATVLPLGHALGRVGCFFAGCCHGIAYRGPLHCTYSLSAGSAPPNTPLLPIQLIEAVILLGIFALLILLYNRNSPHVVAVYLLAYGTARFILEFFRGDAQRGKFLFLSTSQWIGILLSAVAIRLLYNAGRANKSK